MAPLDALARAPDPAADIREDAAELNARYGSRDAAAVIALAANQLFPGRIALVSSFGAESAVLLHLVSEVDRTLPVIFLDTGKLFPETLAYRDALAERLGLTDVRSIAPDPERLAAKDRHGALWMTNPDLCCHFRKTEPLARALTGFDAWFTGRKRFQNSVRSALPLFESDGGRNQGQSARRLGRRRSRRLRGGARPAGPPAGRQGVPVDRLRPLHDQGRAGRGPARRPLARPRQGRMRHPHRPRDRRQRHLAPHGRFTFGKPRWPKQVGTALERAISPG